MTRHGPSSCPACGALLAVTGAPHCESRTCTWLRCACTAVIDATGRHYKISGKAEPA